MIRLCGFRISNYHNKVRIALLEKGVPFEEDASVHGSQKPEYLAKSPMGKVPYLDVDGQLLRESEVILEYLEDAYPQKPLLPKDPLERARVRELVTFIELHMELVVRRLYSGLFFGGSSSDETKAAVEKDIAKGVRALKAVAKFEPYHRGQGSEHCRLCGLRASAHRLAGDQERLRPRLPRGHPADEALPQDAGRAARVRRVNEDRRAATAAAKK